VKTYEVNDCGVVEEPECILFELKPGVYKGYAKIRYALFEGFWIGAFSWSLSQSGCHCPVARSKGERVFGNKEDCINFHKEELLQMLEKKANNQNEDSTDRIMAKQLIGKINVHFNTAKQLELFSVSL
jgi:hypothetical protein